MNSARQTIDTPLGELSVQASGPETARVAIELLKPDITLPEGMSVESVVAALIRIQSSEPISECRCECFWKESPSEGSPESGERLDAQSWDRDGIRVTIGTEDLDALSQRLPALGFTEAQYPVTYSDRGLALTVPYIPGRFEASFHFVVAWRLLSDPADCSTWFAVDIPHGKLKIGRTPRNSGPAGTLADVSVDDSFASLSVSFGDNVFIRSTPETEAAGVSGLRGQVYGMTTPSVTGVAVIGQSTSDCAVNVYFKEIDDSFWFVPAVVEFLDHAPGTEIKISGVAKRWIRTEAGEWREEALEQDR